MFLLKSVLCSLLAISSVSSINAWGFRETEAERIVRVEAEKLAHERYLEQVKTQEKVRVAREQHQQAAGHVKSNFRLESSYSALKEARKAMLCFILAYPALAGALYYFDKAQGESYFSYIPHLIVGLCVLWGTENILRGQVELNKGQYAQASALNK